VVDGSRHPGDRDLVLHVAVARDHGWSAGDPVAASAPSPADVFGAVAHQTVVGQLAAELRWAAERAPASYAVLNACRALRFVTDGSLCSKTSGGEWAIAAGIEPDLVSCALALRRGSAATVPEAAARRWVLSVGRSLEE
jgi:streptomycin 3"-adenylyltransferase